MGEIVTIIITLVLGNTIDVMNPVFWQSNKLSRLFLIVHKSDIVQIDTPCLI
jgi:hypothetical protein